MENETTIIIWRRLYDLHWDYVQTEENSTDLLSKKDILKEYIKEFLIETIPGRKFYLPQTVTVLKGSVQKLKHFSAYEASIAFDAIAQYANNLLTKPWRKEYKVIKTHSGFYQHKIKSQLADVDQLFIAMGYVKSQNQTLVFDGPICPDQLGNVSRDCMIACEECLIMFRIYYGLHDSKVNVSWAEIYNHREIYKGDEHQSLYNIQQKKMSDRVPENFINQPALRCHCNIVHPPPQYQQCLYNTCLIGNNGCTNHPPVAHFNCLPHYDHISHVPHSRSMDQYTDYSSINHEQYRHSLDHSIVSDTLDGHQRLLPYVPIPQTIHPSTSSFHNNPVNHYNGSEHASISASIRPTNVNFPSNKISPRNYNQPVKYENHPKISHYPTNYNCDDDLIKFDEGFKSTIKSDRSYNHQDQLTYEPNNADYIHQLRKADSQLNRPIQPYSYANTLKQGAHFENKQQLLEKKLREIELTNGPLKSSRDDRSLERRRRNRQILADIDDQNSRDSRASDFDSVDYDEENAKASRNKDGQGSMEEWNYVYNGIKNNQNNGNSYNDGLRYGNDKVNELQQRNVSKRIKEPKSSTLIKEHMMTNKTSKLRGSKIEVDEHELHKNVNCKKPQKNGRPTDNSTVSVSVPDWNCEYCTYINSGTVKICSMCSKSRILKEKPKSLATSV